MWKVVILVVIIIILVFWVVSYSDWHVKRNRNNKLPVNYLKLYEENKYTDESGLIWELQPNSKNIFHQPDTKPKTTEAHKIQPPGPVPPVTIPHPFVSVTNIHPIQYDEDYPNKKFLSFGPKGDSYEAIVQPEGTLLTTGPKQGTYNYSNPTGIWGNTKHVFLDVIPHLFNSDYKSD